MTVVEKVKEAVDSLGGEATNAAVRERVLEKHPDTNRRSIDVAIVLSTVNHPTRIHYPQNYNARTADDPRYDFLYRDTKGHIQRYDPSRHGEWAIVKREDGSRTIRELSEGDLEDEAPAIDEIAEDGEPSKSFATENHLRDYLAQNLPTIEAGLSLYTGEGGAVGVEYSTPVGRINLLTVDKEGGFLVIELKVRRGSDVACGQLLRYMGWVRKHLADGRSVRGAIIAETISERMRYAVGDMDHVRLMEYDLSVKIRPVA